MTIAFVLSWSMLDVMACEPPVLASATVPVEEVITDGKNGCLSGYFDEDQLVARVGELMEDPQLPKPLANGADSTLSSTTTRKSTASPGTLP